MEVAAFYELLFEPLELLGPGSDVETRRLLAGLLPGRRATLLELGAGQGRSAIQAARETTFRVVATDASPAFVGRMRERAALAGVAHRVEARVADLRAPGALGRFDALLCEGAAYVAGFEPFLATARALLFPGGRLALSYPVRSEEPGGERVLAFWAPQIAEPLRSAGELGRAARDAGFTVCDAWVYGEAPWRAYLAPVAARLDTVARAVGGDPTASAELAAFRDEIRVQLDEGGHRFFTYGALVLEAP